MNLKKRIPVYVLGLFIMAFGIVLISKANIGVSPSSAIPFAASVITHDSPWLTFGRMTTAFHILCILVQILMLRRITIKIVLQLPLATVFGLIIDMFMAILNFGETGFWLRLVFCVGGTFFTALGIVIIVNTDLMLPPPDAMLRAISVKYNKKLAGVKVIGDVSQVAITLIMGLVFAGGAMIMNIDGLFSVALIASAGSKASETGAMLTTINIGTLLSMLLTGKFIGMLKKRMKFLEMEPTDVRRRACRARKPEAEREREK